MPGLVRLRRALISVSDKTGLVDFARELTARGVEIISTGGTARTLTEAGISVRAVQDVTGFPEMMDGRIKTLHPIIHGGLLGRRDEPEHVEAMARHGIEPIDLVCINLYPFEATVRRPGVTEREAIEQVDIGGPAMVRSSAKNHAFVTVVTDVRQYERLLDEVREHDGATTAALRRELAVTAFARTAAYDAAIAAWMAAHADAPLPSTLALHYTDGRPLRYGENPHQAAAVYTDPEATGPSVVSARLLHGKPLSYNNLNDAAAALALVQDLAATAPERAAAALIKHTNPCGAAVAATLADAFVAAYAGDPLAAYGGILAVSRRLDRATAAAIADGQKFLEVVIAPGYDAEALTLLGERWKNVRLLDAADPPQPAGGHVHRSIPGGLLVQDRDTATADPGTWVHRAGPAPTPGLLQDAAVMWMVVKHLSSNAIAIGSSGRLLGAGAGQVDRVGACRIAIAKAGERLDAGPDPVIAASDAFFPFDDGPRLLVDAGASCIVHPGGSKRDGDTDALCEERGVTCLHTGVRHFRH